MIDFKRRQFSPSDGMNFIQRVVRHSSQSVFGVNFNQFRIGPSRRMQLMCLDVPLAHKITRSTFGGDVWGEHSKACRYPTTCNLLQILYNLNRIVLFQMRELRIYLLSIDLLSMPSGPVMKLTIASHKDYLLLMRRK